MGVQVTINQGRLARLLSARGTIAERRLRRRTERVADLARAYAPGTMGRYIEARVEQAPQGLVGVVECTHPATKFVLEGTRPHVIRPRRANVLRFEVGGRAVFARKVNHPGTRANNFLARALEQGR